MCGNPGILAMHESQSELSDIAGNPLRALNLLQSRGTSNQERSHDPLWVFPNPTTGKVFVEIPKGLHTIVSVHLFDALGRKVLAFDADQIKMSSGRAELDLRHLAVGTYRIELTGKSEAGTFMGHALLVRK
jgi:hypothetical protein